MSTVDSKVLIKELERSQGRVLRNLFRLSGSMPLLRILSEFESQCGIVLYYETLV